MWHSKLATWNKIELSEMASQIKIVHAIISFDKYDNMKMEGLNKWL